MKTKTLPSSDMLTRLMADADRRMSGSDVSPPLARTLFNRLLTANLFVVTTFATAVGGIFLIGLL